MKKIQWNGNALHYTVLHRGTVLIEVPLARLAFDVLSARSLSYYLHSLSLVLLSAVSTSVYYIVCDQQLTAPATAPPRAAIHRLEYVWGE